MAKSPNITLWLVRSGRTEWDDARRLQGATDLPLHEHASEDLTAALAEMLAGHAPAPTVIHTSPDEASAQTGKLVGSIASAGAAKVKAVAGVKAITMGLWEGLLEDELAGRYPKQFKAWREAPGAVSVPEGEAMLDGQSRILTALAKLADKAETTPLVVVLRPVEYALVRAVLDNAPAERLWSAAQDAPAADIRTINRAAFRDALDAMHTPA